MKRFLGVLAVVAMLLGAAVPGAQAFSLGGYQGPVLFHFSGVESSAVYGGACAGVAACDAAQTAPGTFIPGGTAGPAAALAGEDGWGIFFVSTITKPDLTVLWTDGTAGEHLTGIFYNVQDFLVTFPIGVVQHTRSTGVGGGGFNIDVYLDSAATPGAGLPTLRGGGGTTYPGYTEGALFLSLLSVPGADALVPAAHLAGDFNLATAAGSSQAFADVTGGSYMLNIVPGTIATNIGTFADFGFTFDIKPAANPNVTPGASPWTAQFNDPAVTTVPEPTSLLLLGAALAGLAGVGYARRKN